MRRVALVLALGLSGCGLVPGLAPAPMPVADGPTIGFDIPNSWTALPGTPALHYFTTGDPDVCDGVVGACDPSTYVMEADTMDVRLEPIVDERECAEEGRPSWDARVEVRPAVIREATYGLTWTVCYPGSGEAVAIVADVRTGNLETRDALLGDLRSFVDSVVLIGGPAGDREIVPEGK